MSQILLLKYDQCFFVVVQNQAIEAKYQCLSSQMKLGNANEQAQEECELEYERVLAELGEKMGCPPNQRKSNIAMADQIEQLLKLI